MKPVAEEKKSVLSGVPGSDARQSLDGMRSLTKWTVAGVEREALFYLPSTSSEFKPPVILAFHGHRGIITTEKVIGWRNSKNRKQRLSSFGSSMVAQSGANRAD
jgi:hypothetical protein